MGQSFRTARVVELFDGLARQPVVVGQGVRQQRVDARVADVLQLLPIRRVDVGLVRGQLHGSPADVPDPPQRFVTGVEGGPQFEWKSREMRLDPVDGQRLIGSGHVQFEEAPGAEP